MRKFNKIILFLFLSVIFSGDPTIANSLSLLDNNGSLYNLSRGHTYSINPITSEVSPIFNGKESGEVWQFSITGDPSAKVWCGFALPKFLIGEYEDSIPCFFSPKSACDPEIDSVWNPSNGYIFTLNDLGTKTINLGITVTIPCYTRSSLYTASIQISASYIGNTLNKISTSGEYAYIVTVGDSDIPSEYVLYQNYPNPFNPGTTIAYGLPNASHVTLTIYNILGQQVASPVDEDQNAGYHDVVFNSERLPSGIYFYQLRAGNFSKTKILMIVK